MSERSEREAKPSIDLDDLIANARKAALNADWFRGNGTLISKLADALEARQVDEAALADVIANENQGSECGGPHIDAKSAARAVVEFLGERHEPEPRAKACSNCGTEFDDCTVLILGPEHRACCSRCTSSDTHDDPKLKPEPVAPQPSEDQIEAEADEYVIGMFGAHTTEDIKRAYREGRLASAPLPPSSDWKNFYADNNPYRATALGLTAGQEGGGRRMSDATETVTGTLVQIRYEDGTPTRLMGCEDCECPSHDDAPPPRGQYVTIRLDDEGARVWVGPATVTAVAR